MKLLLLAVGIVLFLGAAIYLSLPLVTVVTRSDRDTFAVQTLRTIHNAQAQFHAMKERFGTLQELAASGLIGSNFSMNRPVAGYVYVSVSATSEGYCVRAMAANERQGNRDFNITEEGEVRFHETRVTDSQACGKGHSLLKTQ